MQSRIVVGIDQTWTVVDQALSGDVEVKYTVDSVGTELLLYRDSVAPQLLSRDRSAVRRSRLIGALPVRLQHAIGRSRQAITRMRRSARDHVHGTRARSRRATGLVPVGGTFSPHYAAVVDTYDSLTEEQDQRDIVLSIFRVAGIEAAVIPSGQGKRAVTVIRDVDQRRAFIALARQLGRPWYVVPLDTPVTRPRRLTVRRLQRLCAASDGFRVFRYVAAAPDRVLANAMLGCDVEVWRAPQSALLDRPAPARDFTGALVAPRRNAWATKLGPDTWQDADTRLGHLVDVGSLPHIFDVHGPIDVVYTWVDGTDPNWLAAKDRALGHAHPDEFAAESVDLARFRSHDELKYSLRSLEMYAPWVRKIFLVTAGQRPEWLVSEHPKLQVVDHKEIFSDPTVLPVFNSHAIESQLHHISGLSDQYIYLNDDVFFGRPVSKDLFFHSNGLSKFFLSTAVVGLGPRRDDDTSLVHVAKNNRAFLAEEFEQTVSHQFQHAPHPQLRPVMEEMERKHPEVFTQVSASTFRNKEDLSIASAVHHYYGYGLGRAVPGRLEYLYLDLGHPGASQRLEQLLRSRAFDVFCINDTPAPPRRAARQAQILSDFMERHFPLPSSFEQQAPLSDPDT